MQETLQMSRVGMIMVGVLTQSSNLDVYDTAKVFCCDPLALFTSNQNVESVGYGA